MTDLRTPGELNLSEGSEGKGELLSPLASPYSLLSLSSRPLQQSDRKVILEVIEDGGWRESFNRIVLGVIEGT